MKYNKVLKIINKKAGFMVSFEYIKWGTSYPDHFPDKFAGEKLIKTEKKAWKLAEKFANNTKGIYINIFVVDNNFNPVEGYKDRIIKNK